MLSNCEPPMNGTVIMADHQTAGRGQYGNKWIAHPKTNLTASYYLDTRFVAVSKQFNFNKAVSLAIYDCLTHFCIKDCKIKWPNDFYVENKKIGGVLIENRIQGSNLKDSIVGIGLNVNQSVFSDMKYATSFFQVLRKKTDLMEVLKQLSIMLEKRYLQFKDGVSLDEEYLSLLFRKDEDSLFKTKDGIFKGCIVGVDEIGRLLIASEEGLHCFNIQEVAVVL